MDSILSKRVTKKKTEQKTKIIEWGRQREKFEDLNYEKKQGNFFGKKTGLFKARHNIPKKFIKLFQ